MSVNPRALDHYLNPFLPRKPAFKPNTIYKIAPGIDSEELLANACETLTSAKIMANDFAGLVDGSQRHVLLGIAQLIMLGVCDCSSLISRQKLFWLVGGKRPGNHLRCGTRHGPGPIS